MIQWWRSAMPSNSLAVLNGLALDCRERRVLGADVELETTAIDEANTRVHPLESGVLRRRVRPDRRPGIPVEGPRRFHLRSGVRCAALLLRAALYDRRQVPLRRRLKRDARAFDYRDAALRSEPQQGSSGERASELPRGGREPARSRS